MAVDSTTTTTHLSVSAGDLLADPGHDLMASAGGTLNVEITTQVVHTEVTW